jgi:esterase/lipase
MTIEQTAEEYKKYVVPESRNIARSSTKIDGKIDFTIPHNPLLIIAGEKDNIVPSSLNKKNYNSYKDQNSITAFMEFAGRTHYICGQHGWQEVASYIDSWILSLR